MCHVRAIPEKFKSPATLLVNCARLIAPLFLCPFLEKKKSSRLPRPRAQVNFISLLHGSRELSLCRSIMYRRRLFVSLDNSVHEIYRVCTCMYREYLVRRGDAVLTIFIPSPSRGSLENRITRRIWVDEIKRYV